MVPALRAARQMRRAFSRLSLAPTSGVEGTTSDAAEPGEPSSTSVATPKRVTPGAVVLRGAEVVGVGRVDLEIRDGRIAAIGEVAARDLPEIDVKGRFIAPAFVDSHVHLAYAFDAPTLANGGVAAVVDLAASIEFLRSDHDPLQVIAAGPMITAIEGYPFHLQTERFSYRAEVGSNWKLFMDAFQEFYHAPVLHARQSPYAARPEVQEAGFHGLHYAIDGPHRLVSTYGPEIWKAPPEIIKPTEVLTRSGLAGPWDAPDLGPLPAGVNPAGTKPWGLDSFQIWPNFVILIWERGWYLTYHYWPTSYNTHIFEGTLYFPQPRTPRERIAQELAAVSFKEYGLQDANTLEATQTMVEGRVVDEFLLCDQEVLIRHLHKETAAWVDDYRHKTAGV